MANQRMNHVEAVRVGNQLLAVCHRHYDGTAQYDEGWDDTRVAETCGVTKWNVAYLRQKMVGRMPKPRAVPNGDAVDIASPVMQTIFDRLNKLESEPIAQLTLPGLDVAHQLAQMQERLDNLEKGRDRHDRELNSLKNTLEKLKKLFE